MKNSEYFLFLFNTPNFKEIVMNQLEFCIYSPIVEEGLNRFTFNSFFDVLSDYLNPENESIAETIAPILHQIPLICIAFCFLENSISPLLKLILRFGTELQIATLARLAMPSADADEVDDYLQWANAADNEVFLCHLPLSVREKIIQYRHDKLLLQESALSIALRRTDLKLQLISALKKADRISHSQIQACLRPFHNAHKTLQTLIANQQKLIPAAVPLDNKIFEGYIHTTANIKRLFLKFTKPGGWLSTMSSFNPPSLTEDIESDSFIEKAQAPPFIDMKAKFFTGLDFDGGLSDVFKLGLRDVKDFSHLSLDVKDLPKINEIFKAVLQLSPPNSDLNYLRMKLEDLLQCKIDAKARRGFIKQFFKHLKLKKEKTPEFTLAITKILDAIAELKNISPVVMKKINRISEELKNGKSTNKAILRKTLRIFHRLTLFGRVERYLQQSDAKSSIALASAWEKFNTKGYSSISQLFENQVIINQEQLFNLKANT